MAVLTTCEIKDLFCMARPTRGSLRGLVVACFCCGKATCLSCAVRMVVPGKKGLTMGLHMVCHGCAPRLLDGTAMVATHLGRMGFHGVPSAAPQTHPDAVRFPSALADRKKRIKPKPKPKAKAKDKPKAARERAPTAADPWSAALPAPADPAASYPHALAQRLGYAK